MISPHTPPGTKVVCINVRPHTCCEAVPRVVLGEIYTVACMVDFVVDIGVVLEERLHPGHPFIKGGYNRADFRLAELPKSITDCLNVQPIDVPELVSQNNHGPASLSSNTWEPGRVCTVRGNHLHSANFSFGAFTECASPIAGSLSSRPAKLAEGCCDPSRAFRSFSFRSSLQRFNTHQPASPSVVKVSASSSMSA